MMKVTISEWQVTQSRVALSILKKLTENNIRGSAIDRYVTRQGGGKIHELKRSPSPSSRFIPITICDVQYMAFGTSLLSVCGFGLLSDQFMLQTNQPIDIHSMGVHILDSLVEQFMRKNAVQFFILGSGGLIGMEISGPSREVIHWYGLHIALLCFQLHSEDIMNEAASRREDVLYFIPE